MLLALVAEVTDRPVWVLAFATIALAAAGWAALLSLIESRKARNSRALAALSARWEDPYLYESIRVFRGLKIAGTIDLINHLFVTDVASPDLKRMATWHQIEVWSNLVETVGGFWREGVMAERMIYRLWSSTIIEAWENDWQEPTKRLREISNDQTVWENFELLAGTMKEIRAKEARRSGSILDRLTGLYPL